MYLITPRSNSSLIFSITVSVISSLTLSSVDAAKYEFKNNTRNEIGLVIASSKFFTDSSGDLGATTTVSYQVQGWYTIVSGGEKTLNIPSGEVYVLVAEKDPSGRVKYRRYWDFKAGSQDTKYYRGFLIYKNGRFKGIQYSSSALDAKQIKKLNGKYPSSARGKILESKGGPTGDWGKFGFGDPRMSYEWGFKKLKGSSERVTTFSVE